MWFLLQPKSIFIFEQNSRGLVFSSWQEPRVTNFFLGLLLLFYYYIICFCGREICSSKFGDVDFSFLLSCPAFSSSSLALLAGCCTGDEKNRCAPPYTGLRGRWQAVWGPFPDPADRTERRTPLAIHISVDWVIWGHQHQRNIRVALAWPATVPGSPDGPKLPYCPTTN